MRSSGSTPSPRPSLPIRLLIVLAREDHAKACTGSKLLHRGLATPVPRIEGLAPAPVVLDPYAPDPLSRRDRAPAERGGLLAVDCSWNRLAQRGRFPGTDPHLRPAGLRRRLPLLVAANPQHYGRVAELNTVEALSAALYLLGRRDEARGLLDGFRGGPAFLSINRERLDGYAAQRTPEAVERSERQFYG